MTQQDEPLEYWNAVEGWVKLDEVRKHFDSVSCGTIYKNGGEGRVPLCLAQPKQEQEPVAYINIEKRRLEWAYDYMSWDTPTVINLPRIPLYTTPQQRTWVGLTDEDDIDWEDGGNLKDLVKAIEAKLKDKNL